MESFAFCACNGYRDFTLVYESLFDCHIGYDGAPDSVKHCMCIGQLYCSVCFLSIFNGLLQKKEMTCFGFTRPKYKIM